MTPIGCSDAEHWLELPSCLRILRSEGKAPIGWSKLLLVRIQRTGGSHQLGNGQRDQNLDLKRAILGGKGLSPSYAHLDVPEDKKGRESPKCPSSYPLMSGPGRFGDRGLWHSHNTHTHT